MTAIVLRGDARHLPLPDASVDLIVTSPPYFGLRSYTDGGEHYPGQIGSEATPGEWLDALLACTREWVRVLKPEGSLFVNLGDKYCGYTNGQGKGRNLGGGERSAALVPDGPVSAPTVYGIPNKSLLGLPWRYAIGCTDRLGLILRAEIIWAKPNGLPESVTDRVRRAHEQVFHFTRQPRYYSAVDEIREPHAPASMTRYRSGFGQTTYSAETDKRYRAEEIAPNPLGKLPGSVWSIPSQPLQVPAHLGIDHFAAFPMELPRRLILGWSPPGVCTACGQGRRPVADRDYEVLATRTERSMAYRALEPLAKTRMYDQTMAGRTIITGYACACGAEISPMGKPAGRPGMTSSLPPTRPAVVLDPFGGTGTTALVASVLGRHGITADLSADYGRLARWRVNDPGERARAMGVPKPPRQLEGQEALFT